MNLVEVGTITLKEAVMDKATGRLWVAQFFLLKRLRATFGCPKRWILKFFDIDQRRSGITCQWATGQVN